MMLHRGEHNKTKQGGIGDLPAGDDADDDDDEDKILGKYYSSPFLPFSFPHSPPLLSLLNYESCVILVVEDCFFSMHYY